MALKGYSQILNFDSQADLVNVTPNSGQLAYCIDTNQFYKYNGLAWMPSDKVVVKKSAVVINGLTTGTVGIYTMEPSTLNFYPTQVIFRSVNISGTTIKPTVSVGSNANADNIMSGSLLSTLMATVGANGGVPQMASVSYPIAGGTTIKANVSIAGVATSYTFLIEVIGFYDN